MQLRVLNQKAGTDPIGNEVRNLLGRRRNRFMHVKVLMAFVNRDGVRYIKNRLEAFYDSGGILEFIIGIDNGITTHEALKYLRSRFPEASLFLFHDNSARKVFHHKVIILENDKTVVCVMGSANLTLGGMFGKFESAIVAEFDRNDDTGPIAALAQLWDAYRNPKAPMDPRNLEELTTAWLREHAAMLRESAQRQRQPERITKFAGFVATRLPQPSLDSWPRDERRRSIGITEGKPVRHARKLLVEVLKETGAGGTQIQLPTESLTDFFGGSMARPTHLRLSFQRGKYRDGYICHFDNNTHRVNIRELGDVPRPSLLLFERDPLHRNTYTCKILRGKMYRTALKQCTSQTRAKAKRWGIIG